MATVRRYELEHDGTAKINGPRGSVSITRRNVVFVRLGRERTIAPRSALLGVRLAPVGSETRTFEVRLVFHGHGLPTAIKVFGSIDHERAAGVAKQIGEHLGVVVLGRD